MGTESGRTGLRAFEKETIINYTQAEPEASVYTAQRGLWLELERKGYKAEREFRNQSGVLTAKEFLVPKGRIAVFRKRVGSKPSL